MATTVTIIPRALSLFFERASNRNIYIEHDMADDCYVLYCKHCHGLKKTPTIRIGEPNCITDEIFDWAKAHAHFIPEVVKLEPSSSFTIRRKFRNDE